jgi:hypothetical protein
MKKKARRPVADKRSLLQAIQGLEQRLDRAQDAGLAGEKRLNQALGLGLANAVRQMEAFLGIQHYLQTGEGITGFHGWPISPDVGLLLLDKIRENGYALIIEFGSGTSTVLLAKALNTLVRTRGEPAAWQSHRLVHRIVSFEHDPRYLNDTARLLDTHAAADRVRLLHAPLIDWLHGEQVFHFYDCAAELARLDTTLGHAPARILVLVDGPPGRTCPLARYPAIPLLFQHLGRHHIDIVLDDANRTEEQAAIEAWRAHWQARSTRIEEHFPASEKGLYFAATSPPTAPPHHHEHIE